MSELRKLILSSLIVTGLATGAVAQNAAQDRVQFDLPEVGTQLPDVTIYDAAGQPVSTADLRGEYSVVVFGCLT